MIVNHLPEILRAQFEAKRRRVVITEIANEVQIGYSTCWNWMNGNVKQYEPETLSKWCAYLNVGVGDILEYIEDVQP